MATRYYELCQAALASIEAGTPDKVAQSVYECFILAGGPQREVGWGYVRQMLAEGGEGTATYSELDFSQMAEAISIAHGISGEDAVEEAISIVDEFAHGSMVDSAP